MAGEQEKKPLSRLLESLGWLSQSAVQPKKQRMIEGVSASSLVAFKSELYKVQQEQQAIKEGRLDPEELRQRRKGLAGLLERTNAGVVERDTKDRLEIKSTSDRAAEAYAALEKKAALYERLSRGEAADEEDRYEVDFLMKEREAPPAVDTAALAAYTQTGGLSSADMARERERRDWEAQAHEEMAAAELREQERERRRELLDEVIDETEADRQRALEQKRQRQAVEQQKREKLKAAFLKKQLEMLKAKQQQAGKQQQQAQRQGGKQ